MEAVLQLLHHNNSAMEEEEAVAMDSRTATVAMHTAKNSLNNHATVQADTAVWDDQTARTQ